MMGRQLQRKFLVLVAALVLIGPAVQGANLSAVDWLNNEKAAFEQARASQRPVLLYLEAVWCHWCHVIDRETYGNPAVAALIAQHFVPLRIDQDNRPDLANRYRNFGWPATIFLAPDGTDLVKRRGYINPEAMLRLLQAIIDDPSPEAAAALQLPEAFSTTSSLAPALAEKLTLRHLNTWDEDKGGLTIRLKFVERDSAELDLVLGGDGDAQAALRAARTLDAALALIDPVWGGVYQYSTGGDWRHPHFEKLGTLQGEYMRLYALAGARLGQPRYTVAAGAIAAYVREFLRSPQGAFYASQDADLVQGEKAAAYFALADAPRRALGIPRIDKQIYARENGAIIEGLATLYEFGKDPRHLEAAETAAYWVVANRALADGGFSHGAEDVAGPFLGDTLAMGRAFLALYKVTAQRHWLDRARAASRFIDSNFQANGAGYVTGINADAIIRPLPQIDENIALARFTNLLQQVSGEPQHRAVAERAMRYLTTPGVALKRITEAGVLLADRELNRDPLHLTVLGGKDDLQAQTLFDAALDQPGWYKRAEWWDYEEGPLPNPDVTYPQLSRAAVFVCTNDRCSLPLYESEQLVRFLIADRQD